MGQLDIDLELCNQDGICAAVCGRQLIEFSSTDPFPRPGPTAEEECNKCGHCLAACPSGAITVDGVRADDCPPLTRDLLPGSEQVAHLIRARRSIRRFRKKEVEQEVIQELLDLVRHAPTTSNSQMVHWVVLLGRERLAELAGLVVDWLRRAVEEDPENPEVNKLIKVIKAWEEGQDRIFHHAPALIVNHAPENVSLYREDCAIALTYLELAAPSMGLGACWLGFLMMAAQQDPRLREALGIPSDHLLHGAMIIGYPGYAYHRLPPREDAKVVWR